MLALLCIAFGAQVLTLGVLVSKTRFLPLQGEK